MMYRHFPGIENRDFSILALSLEGTGDRAKARSLLEAAAKNGINLVWTGSDPETTALVAGLLEETGLREAFSLLTVFDVNLEETGNPKNGDESTQELRALLDAARSGPGDFLVLRLTGDGDCKALAKSGLLRAASTLKSGGRIGACGFWTEPSAATIIGTIDAWNGWDFFSTDCNYALMGDEKAGLEGALKYAAAAEIGFIATDPFAGGRLETVPPAVHEIFRLAPVPRSHDEWALRAVWERQETVSIAWAPPDVKDLERKAIFAEAGRPNSLPSAELNVLKDAARKLAE